MKVQKPTLYFIITLGSVALLVVLMLGAFAGGILLAPYLSSEADAAALSESTTLVHPTARLALADDEPLAAYEQALTQVYRNTLPAVVNIRVTQKIEPEVRDNRLDFPFGPFGPFSNQPFPRTPEEFYNRGQGSGFVWDKEGHIVTNYHVVENASDVEVVFADGKSVEAEVLGTDPDADLAVVKVDLPASDLNPLPLGDSDELQVGQLAIALGNPFGQEFTMTTGIISAVGRTIRSGNSPFSIPEVIQTDAAINPGNSGGPLLTRRGEVVGINTQIISRSGSNAGIGFAVPINIAKQIVPTLIKGESFEYAWLGITGTTLSAEVIDFMKLPSDTRGALVISVTQDSPADEAGLQGSDKILKVAGAEYQLGGDVIVAIDDQPVEDMEDLITYLVEETRPGDEVTLKVIRSDGEQESISLVLGARPDGDDVGEEDE